MNVFFRSNAGPLEGFTRASFRTAINDDGIGSITAPPDIIDAVDGPILCEVDGNVVFSWTPEERETESTERDLVTLSGRGRSAILERVIVLPVGYPNFTERTRNEQGAPLAVFATLLGEAQARGRATDLNPTWTATEDSKGQPWTETVDVQLEPGTNLRELLDNLSEVEGSEWYFRPNGDLDAAPQIGDDLSDEVVLFLGNDQVFRNIRVSSREQRQTIFIEASTGVSQATNSADPDAGELWLEAQDYADSVSRQTLADKLALKLGAPEEEVDLTIAPDSGAYNRFSPGDLIALDTGNDAPETVRLVAIAVEVEDTAVVNVEATLISEVGLFQQRIQRAIEAKADVKLAASPSIQRRHGLVTADKFLSGAVGDDVAISSENFVPAIPGPGEGWAIFGNGDAEFNDAIFRGDLQSDNYVPDLSGWRLDRDGDAEFANIQLRDTVTFVGDELQTVDNLRVQMDISDRSLTVRYTGPANEIAGALSAIVEVPGQTLPPAAFRGVILSATQDQRLLVQRELVSLDSGNGSIIIAANDTSGLVIVDGLATVHLSNVQFDEEINVTGQGFFQNDLSVSGNAVIQQQLDVIAGATVGAGFSVLSGQTSLLGNLFVAGTTSMTNDLSVIGSVTATSFSGNGSGLTNLPLPSNPTFNSVRVNTSLFFNTAGFPRFEQAGTSVMLRGTGRLRMKFDGGFDLEDGDIRLGAGTAISTITRFGNANLQDITAGSLQTSIMFLPALFETGLSANLRRDTFAPFRVRLSTSSIRYKQDVTPAPVLDRLLDVEPVTFRGISEVQEHGDKAPVGYGAIAEWVHDLGLTHLVDYSDGRPNAVNYDRIGVALIPHVRALRDRIEQLEARP